MFADSTRPRAALRNAASNVCTMGNVIALLVVGLALALGVAVVTSDPIETHAEAISDVPRMSEGSSASAAKDTKAAVSALATVGLSTGVGGLGHAEPFPSGASPAAGVPESVSAVPPGPGLNGETTLPPSIAAEAVDRVLDATATTPSIE